MARKIMNLLDLRRKPKENIENEIGKIEKIDDRMVADLMSRLDHAIFVSQTTPLTSEEFKTFSSNQRKIAYSSQKRYEKNGGQQIAMLFGSEVINHIIEPVDGENKSEIKFNKNFEREVKDYFCKHKFALSVLKLNGKLPVLKNFDDLIKLVNFTETHFQENFGIDVKNLEKISKSTLKELTNSGKSLETISKMDMRTLTEIIEDKKNAENDNPERGIKEISLNELLR